MGVLRDMLFLRMKIGLILVAVLAALILLVYVGIPVFLFALDPSYRALIGFQRDFEQVTLGMEREDVEGRLGPPDDSGDDFHLGQRETYEDAYERAAQSGATYYLTWYRWVDMTFTIGFDANDKVVVAESGGT